MSEPAPKTCQLDLAHAMYKLRVVSPHDLPALARDLLSDECDSRSLRRLAVTEDERDAEKLFENALGELGCTPISMRDAALRYARWISTRVLKGEVKPYDGAKAIWRVSLDLNETPVPELDPFIYAASEWEDRPEDRAFFDEAIKKEALRFVA